MSQPITLTDAKTAAKNYLNNGRYKSHLQGFNPPIKGFLFKRTHLKSLLTSTTSSEIFMFWVLKSDQLDLVVGELKINSETGRTDLVTTNLFSSKNPPHKGRVVLGRDAAGSEDIILRADGSIDIQKAIIGEGIDASHLKEMIKDHMKGVYPDALNISVDKKVLGYVMDKLTIERLDILNGSGDDEFLFMPVIRKYESSGNVTTLAKPYLSIAISQLNGDRLGNVIREYISPCPNNCPDNINDLYT